MGHLPEPAPEVAAGVPAPGRLAVVLFLRGGRVGELCHALAGTDLAQRADLAVVVAAPASDAPCPTAAAVVEDPTAELARRYGVRTPRGGGPPVGYAVVDSSGDTRYRTLDPTVAQQLDEVATILGAAP